ncbi:MAG: radical SAM family heme chaperone HemW [Clostridiales bacterium]|nr:radical SAM family heme chaperone HemW [Candidatus Equinaster intestinalis]
MTNPFSIYIHVPFCVSKCAYCAFYSVTSDTCAQNNYRDKIIEELKTWGGRITRPVCSVYFGGGTPSVLGAENLSAILQAVKDNFSLEKDAEITLEANPGDELGEMLKALREAGFNRLSLGMQSANADELRLLSRRHSSADVENAVKSARKAGFDNISLDLMLALPDSNAEKLKNSIDFALSLSPEHISAYILKIEENTPFFARKEGLSLPDDDTTAEQYLFLCEYLREKGYFHYEISNFSKKGFQSRHNNGYWTLRDYLGLGPSAHSLIDGKRFFYENDLKKYLVSPTPIFEDTGADEQEYIMLGLRLSRGISSAEFSKRFGKKLPEAFLKKAELLAENGLAVTNGETISLTDKGMLVSNSVITYLLEE